MPGKVYFSLPPSSVGAVVWFSSYHWLFYLNGLYCMVYCRRVIVDCHSVYHDVAIFGTHPYRPVVKFLRCHSLALFVNLSPAGDVEQFGVHYGVRIPFLSVESSNGYYLTTSVFVFPHGQYYMIRFGDHLFRVIPGRQRCVLGFRTRNKRPFYLFLERDVFLRFIPPVIDLVSPMLIPLCFFLNRFHSRSVFG